MQTHPATHEAAVRRATADLPSTLRVAIIQSAWHADIVGRAREAAIAALLQAGVPRSGVDVFDVPGAFEIPLVARRLAAAGRHDAIVACGLVVDGGIYRHEFVAASVLIGLMAVQLQTDVPVLSCVLTPHQFHEHATHQGFFAAHFDEKGREVGLACLQALRLHRTLCA
jgi:6,7-dimethyl-8-ribityllumazine synthase